MSGETGGTGAGGERFVYVYSTVVSSGQLSIKTAASRLKGICSDSPVIMTSR